LNDLNFQTRQNGQTVNAKGKNSILATESPTHSKRKVHTEVNGRHMECGIERSEGEY